MPYRIASFHQMERRYGIISLYILTDSQTTGLIKETKLNSLEPV